jgi:predicted amidohydrolase YtcJ
MKLALERGRAIGLLVLFLFLGVRPALAQDDPVYLTGATVISMAPGQKPFTASVMIKGGRIAAIAPRMRVPPHAHRVDLSGRYLMPGFIDMHAHVTFLRGNINKGDPGYDRETSEIVLKDLLAFGVTTVRNPAAPPAESVALREDVAAGRTLGPRIFTAGFPFFGRDFGSDAGIRSEVDRECALKVDYIKVYAGSTPEQTGVAIDEAHKCGLKVIGHVQTTDWPTAADLGIDFLAHAVSWSPSVLPPDKREAYIAEDEKFGPMKG